MCRQLLGPSASMPSASHVPSVPRCQRSGFPYYHQPWWNHVWRPITFRHFILINSVLIIYIYIYIYIFFFLGRISKTLSFLFPYSLLEIPHYLHMAYFSKSQLLTFIKLAAAIGDFSWRANSNGASQLRERGKFLIICKSTLSFPTTCDFGSNVIKGMNSLKYIYIYIYFG